MSAIPNIDFFKSPAWKVNYKLKWTKFLSADSDTIASASWSVPTGLTGTGEANTTTETSIFIYGGSQGVNYEVTCTITTASGQIFSAPVVVHVV